VVITIISILTPHLYRSTGPQPEEARTTHSMREQSEASWNRLRLSEGPQSPDFLMAKTNGKTMEFASGANAFRHL